MRKIFMIMMIMVLAASLWAGGQEETNEIVQDPVEDLSTAQGSITIYTSVPQTIIDNIKIQFEEQYPDITLDIFRAGTSKVLAKLMAEKEADNISADLLWLADFSVFENLKTFGLLLPYDSPEASSLPEEFYDPQGYYYGSRMMFLVLAYNTDLIPPERVPVSWKDLLRPEYEGQIGSSTPERSGAFMVATGAMIQHDDFGWEFFEAMRDNGNVLDSNTGIAKKIANRELAMGFALDYTVRKMIKDGSPIDFVYPEEGAIMTPSPIGIVNTTDNSAAAKVFLNYTLSQAGQQALADNGFVPLNPEVEFTFEDITYQDINFMKTTDYEWIRSNSLNIVETFVSLYE